MTQTQPGPSREEANEFAGAQADVGVYGPCDGVFLGHLLIADSAEEHGDTCNQVNQGGHAVREVEDGAKNGHGGQRHHEDEPIDNDVS
jgi:hypothetical protein